MRSNLHLVYLLKATDFPIKGITDEDHRSVNLKSILRPARPTDLRVTNASAKEGSDDTAQPAPFELCSVETVPPTPELPADQASEPINSPNRSLTSTPTPQPSPFMPSMPPPLPMRSPNRPASRGANVSSASVTLAEVIQQRSSSATNENQPPSQQDGATAAAQAVNVSRPQTTVVITQATHRAISRRDVSSARSRSEEPRRVNRESSATWRKMSW